MQGRFRLSKQVRSTSRGKRRSWSAKIREIDPRIDQHGAAGIVDIAHADMGLEAPRQPRRSCKPRLSLADLFVKKAFQGYLSMQSACR